ncbi:hypothetical protein A3760_01895 [Oleiphilus sp. HI0122]|nr:hypothetical protein A3760_01895 [Oleiphilus sp. HI0122]
MRVTENSHLVIFGASGDLTARMLIPALVHLFATKQLPDRFFVLGVSRSKFSDEQYRSHLAVKSPEAPKMTRWLFSVTRITHSLNSGKSILISTALSDTSSLKPHSSLTRSDTQ